MLRLFLLELAFIFPALCLGQTDKVTQNNTGGWARMDVVDGDTLYTMSLQIVTITAPRIFKTSEERRKYHLYKRCAQVAYPFAVQGISLYNELEEETADLNKRKRKKLLRQTKRELKGDFKDQMKNLTKTQGYILIKMMERQLDMPFYEIIKETQGTANAVYWQNLSKIWGYDLKDRYEVGKDPLLDDILQDYDFGEY